MADIPVMASTIRPITHKDVPVLETRFPVASRYSKDLLISVHMLNIFITNSWFIEPFSLLPLFSKDSFTDDNQAANLSCWE